MTLTVPEVSVLHQSQTCNRDALLQRPSHQTGARARSPRRPRTLDRQLSASDVDLNRRRRDVMLIATEDVLESLPHDALYWRLMACRKEDGPCPLFRLALTMLVLTNLGQAESKLRAIPDFLHEYIDDLFPASERRTLDEVDVEETMLEARENELSMLRRVYGETPELLREEAAVNRREAAVQTERARLLEARARCGTRVAGPVQGGSTAPGRATDVTGRAGVESSVSVDGLQAAPRSSGKVRRPSRSDNAVHATEART